MALDREISDAFGLLAVLLVFVIAYFSALLPQSEDLITRSRPVEEAARKAVVARLRAYLKLTAGFLSLVILVGIVVEPLSWHVVRDTAFQWPLPTLRAGLLLVDLCLVGMLVAGVRLVQRLGSRIRDLEKPAVLPPPPSS